MTTRTSSRPDANGRAGSPPARRARPGRGSYYVEPHGLLGPARGRPASFPPWQLDTIRRVRGARAGRVRPRRGLLALQPAAASRSARRGADGARRRTPAASTACLDALCARSDRADGRARSPPAPTPSSSRQRFAGGGLHLARGSTATFVLPVRARGRVGLQGRAVPDLPVYTHTCGAIGDRLDLLEETGTDGIDTLDPPPLGDVDLAEAKRRVGERLFLKGNVDPVGTLLLGSAEAVRRRRRPAHRHRRAGRRLHPLDRVLRAARRAAGERPAAAVGGRGRLARSASGGQTSRRPPSPGWRFKPSQ